MRRVVAELTWLNRLLIDLGNPSELPIPVHSDSQAAIHIAKNPVFHERTKHVELDCHFVRQQYLVGLISLFYVPASSQLADLFTKALSGPSHQIILPKLGLLTLPSNLRRDVENENHSTPLMLPDRIKNEEMKEKKKESVLVSMCSKEIQNQGQNKYKGNFPSLGCYGHVGNKSYWK